MEKFVKVTTQINTVILGLVTMVYIVGSLCVSDEDRLALVVCALMIGVLIPLNVWCGKVMANLYHKIKERKNIEG